MTIYPFIGSEIEEILRREAVKAMENNRTKFMTLGYVGANAGD